MIARRVAGVLLALLPAATVSAQCLPGATLPDPDASCTFSAPRWAGELASFSANALLGGLTAGVMQHARGGSFSDGFLRGALGGGVVYAGKRVAAERFDGAGLLGREIAAAGISVSRNAALGLPSLSRLSFPIGPIRLNIERSDGVRVRPSLDLVALGWTAWALSRSELSLSAGRSLSAGTLVFRTDNEVLLLGNDSVHAGGIAAAGIILLSDVPAFGDRYLDRSFAHERVHVLQEDQLASLWIDPAADWLLSRTRAGERIAPYVDINLSAEVLRLFGGLFPVYDDRPWELESIFFARD
jgi:hypothetical protein